MLGGASVDLQAAASSKPRRAKLTLPRPRDASARRNHVHRIPLTMKCLVVLVLRSAAVTTGVVTARKLGIARDTFPHTHVGGQALYRAYVVVAQLMPPPIAQVGCGVVDGTREAFVDFHRFLSSQLSLLVFFLYRGASATPSPIASSRAFA